MAKPEHVSVDPDALDPEQAAAATAPDGGAVVMAGAGTGKTRTLVARVLHLVTRRGVPPQEIVCVTFTNKAAGELRQRVAARLGPEVSRLLSVGTFHSLSARMLRRHARRFGLTPRFSIIHEDDMERLVKTACVSCNAVVRMPGENDESHAKRVADYAHEAAKMIRTWKSWGLTPIEIEDPARPKRHPEEENLARVYLSYQDELRRRDLVDFGDLVLLSAQLLSSDELIRADESDRVRHLLVDEAQDANPVQVAWTRLVADSHRNVFAVGDEDQSIFSFQAGYPGAILDLAGAGAARYELSANRRCTKEILVPAVKLVGRNRRSSPKRLVSERSGPAPVMRMCSNDKEEATFIASEISNRLKEGAKPDDCALLVRSSWVMPTLEEALLRANIPYRVCGGTSLSQREEVRDVSAYMRLAIRPMDDLAFMRIANVPTRGLGPAAEAAILARAKFDGAPFSEALSTMQRIGGSKIPEVWREGLRTLAMLLDRLASSGSHMDSTSREVLDLILEDHGAGYAAFAMKGLDRKAAKRRKDMLDTLRRLADEEESIVQYLERVLLAGEEDEEPEENARGHVRLSTMHSSKGLEWDHVFCAAFDAKVIPSPRSVSSVRLGKPGNHWDGPRGGGLEEERRLAHVAFTRAKKTLTVTGSLTRAGAPTFPSVFLPESALESLTGDDPFAENDGFGKGKVKGGSKAGRKGFTRGKSADF